MKYCSKCGDLKAETDFSLTRGKHSGDRKSYCVKCETKARKAKKQGLELEELNALLSHPCFICGDKSSHIDKEGDRVYGVLCKRCHTFLKSVLPTDDQDVTTKCLNYLTFRKDFPFWLKTEVRKTLPERPTPLLDYIDGKRR